LHLVGVLFPHINEDARSKSHQIIIGYLEELSIGGKVMLKWIWKKLGWKLWASLITLRIWTTAELLWTW